MTYSGRLGSLVSLAIVGLTSSCGLGQVVEALEIVSVEAISGSPQLVVTVAHRSCGTEPIVIVDEGDADVIVSAEMRGRECNDIRVETELLIDMVEPLGDRTLVLQSSGGDPNCLIDEERSLRCTVFFTDDG